MKCREAGTIRTARKPWRTSPEPGSNLEQKLIAAGTAERCPPVGTPDRRPFLHEIKCPTLVLCGRQDVVTPIDVHEEMVAGIAFAGFTVIDECGHLSPLGQPRQVTEALKFWLTQISD